jgi:transcriptional regulator GlxA family with amidase domain
VLRAKSDVALRLTAVRDGRAWFGLLSAPYFGTASISSSEAVAHARPRLHQLPTVHVAASDPRPHLPSLTPGMRRRVEEFIEAHLDVPLSVGQIAQAAGMSCSHFARAFRNVLKMTPHRYVMWRRLIRAQELIKDSDTSLADIAVVTGFADQSHLCRLFHQYMGESPSRFRRQCR